MKDGALPEKQDARKQPKQPENTVEGSARVERLLLQQSTAAKNASKRMFHLARIDGTPLIGQHI